MQGDERAARSGLQFFCYFIRKTRPPAAEASLAHLLPRHVRPIVRGDIPVPVKKISVGNPTAGSKISAAASAKSTAQVSLKKAPPATPAAAKTAVLKSPAATKKTPVGAPATLKATDTGAASTIKKASSATGIQKAKTGGAANQLEVAKGVDLGKIGTIDKVPDWELGESPAFLRPRARILRPDDLLNLVVDFENFRLRKVTGRSDGVTHEVGLTDSKKAGVVIVTFQPQNIAEQAFFEVDPNVATTGATPGDKDNGKTNSEEPSAASMPVKTRIAGASRIAFQAPAGTAPIPYTTEGILAWLSTAKMKVAANALPPPEPLYFPLPWLGSRTVERGPLQSVTARAGSAAVTKRSSTTAKTSAKVVTETAPSSSPVVDKLAIRRQLSTSITAREQVELQHGFELVAELTPGIAGMIQLQPEPKEPKPNETALELPYRLFISPHVGGGWAHALKPVKSVQTGRTELWHTRLATRKTNGQLSEGKDGMRTVRAIWSPDAEAADVVNVEHLNIPFRATLDAHDRHNIVHLSSNFRIKKKTGTAKYEPKAIEADRLMLSTLGAWLNARGAWPVNQVNFFDVEEWRHRGTQGRDHYVRVVYAGTLLPFGHRASLIKVTERKFHKGIAGNPAFLRQRMFIVVREPVRTINNGSFTHQESGRTGESYAREMPFVSARITTLVTPSLADPAQSHSKISGTPNLQGFWPHVGAGTHPAPFLFHVQLEDIDGQMTDVAMPMIFAGKPILDGLAVNEGAMASTFSAIINSYNGGPKFKSGDSSGKFYSDIGFGGQRVTYAPVNRPGDTVFETQSVKFGLARQGTSFIPHVQTSAVEIASLKHLAGVSAKPVIAYFKDYLKSGYGPAEIFVGLVGGSTSLNFSGQGDRSGGFVQPNLGITALSRKMGPVGGTAPALSALNSTGTFKPDDFFANALPLLFGCIKLSDILKVFNVSASDLMPKFVTEELNAVLELAEQLYRLKQEVDKRLSQIQAAGAQAQAALQKINTAIEALGAVPDAVTGHAAGFANKLLGKLLAFSDDPSAAGVSAILTTIKTELDKLKDGGNALLAQLPTIIPGATVRRDIEAILTSVVKGLGDTTKFLETLAQIFDAISERRVRFKWNPEIQPWGLDRADALADPGKNALFHPHSAKAFSIAVELAAASKTRSEPSLDIVCKLEDFDLNLIAPAKFLVLRFRKIEFFAGTSRKIDVNVELKDEKTEGKKGVEFVGVLSFVETLRSLIPCDGFSDPPNLSVSEKGIEAGFTLALPNLAVGVFSLQNLSLGASFKVPFIGEPLSVTFTFCSRENPFNLSVMMFGGGGFFAITLTPAGIHIFEIALEFGASLSINLGVASGGVSVVAGIYFKMVDGDASLDGYFRLRGNVSVLGLINASIELYLELHYEFSSHKCVGKATITVEVSVLCFSASVKISCEKKFAGANGDPTFAETMLPYNDTLTGEAVDPWQDYCSAFAA